jgi:hypothetical protein
MRLRSRAQIRSTLEAAPVWLKKNTRIEALMFLEFLAQMVADLFLGHLQS